MIAKKIKIKENIMKLNKNESIKKNEKGHQEKLKQISKI